MKTLEQHNSESWKLHSQMNDNSPRPNGIACPKCWKELVDSNPMITLASYPAQKNVSCPHCNYSWYRLA